MTFEIGSRGYIIESSRFVREVTVIHISGDFYTVKFANKNGGIRVRKSRLYATKEEAEATIPKEEIKKVSCNPYDYWH